MKILEAMALGTGSIYAKGVEGLEVTHNEHVLIADTPDTIAENVIKLLRDPELRKRLSHNARKLIETKYNWDTVLSQFISLVEDVGNKSI
jgi:glycosyltransferase involved in cell wall biosynthesis